MGVKAGLKTLGAIFIAAAVGFAAWPADTADAATKKRTRVVVTKRSYLDAGTEVLPGEYRDRGINYMAPPGFTPYSYYDFTNSYRYPLPTPFWLPGYTGPYGPGGY